MVYMSTYNTKIIGKVLRQYNALMLHSQIHQITVCTSVYTVIQHYLDTSTEQLM